MKRVRQPIGILRTQVMGILAWTEHLVSHHVWSGAFFSISYWLRDFRTMQNNGKW